MRGDVREINVSETVGHVDRRLIRGEFATEALFLAGFKEAQITALGDPSEISTSRLHELLMEKLNEALLFHQLDQSKVKPVRGRKRRGTKARRHKANKK